MRRREVRRGARQVAADVLAVPTDVGRREDVERLKDRAYAAFGEVALLMNNAGRGGAGRLFESVERWQELFATNLWGVIHGVQVFAPAMIAQRTPAAIVNTGSKQGITCPPGNTAYNVTKAGVKVVTEALAHELRSIEGCEVTAHLLIPGFTFTGITAAARETGRRLDGRPGDRLHAAGARARRLLHPLPRQRGDARHRRKAHRLGRRRHRREPPRFVALAPGLQRRLRGVHEIVGTIDRIHLAAHTI